MLQYNKIIIVELSMNLLEVVHNIKQLLDRIRGNLNSNNFLPYDSNTKRTLIQYIDQLCIAVKDDNPRLFLALKNIKQSLFNRIPVNLFQLGRFVQIMELYDFTGEHDWWCCIHPTIIRLSKERFKNGFYADAVQTALVEICSIIRKFRADNGFAEISSDKDMLYNTFSNLRILQFTNSSDLASKNIQEGYEKIFAGVIQAFRNPHAHRNIDISKTEAIRKLMIASDLMYMLDQALQNYKETEF